MDISNLKSFDRISPLTPEITTGGAKPNSKVGEGPSFKETLNNSFKETGNVSFKETLDTQLKTQAPGSLSNAQLTNGVKFSNHAIERMRTRGISYSPEDIVKLNEAVSKANAKGAKDSLILMNDSALIVSVKNNTVVTVMDKSALKENVFTNIDSTIVM